jgi:hypothetical protein
MKKVVILFLFCFATAFVANAQKVYITTSCGSGSGLYSCSGCSTSQWIEAALYIEAVYCGE